MRQLFSEEVLVYRTKLSLKVKQPTMSSLVRKLNFYEYLLNVSILSVEPLKISAIDNVPSAHGTKQVVSDLTSKYRGLLK